MNSDFSDFIRFFPIFRLFPTFRLLDSTTLVWTSLMSFVSILHNPDSLEIYHIINMLELQSLWKLEKFTINMFVEPN